MKKVSFFGLGMACAALAFAQANPRGNAKTSDGSVAVDYGRPNARGRDVMALIEPGTTWRMGADQGTTLTASKDLTFGTTKAGKGTYTLEARFAEKEKWNLVVSKDGTTVAEVPGKFEKAQPVVEQMTIELKPDAGGTLLVLTWGTYRLSAPFKIG